MRWWPCPWYVWQVEKKERMNKPPHLLVHLWVAHSELFRAAPVLLFLQVRLSYLEKLKAWCRICLASTSGGPMLEKNSFGRWAGAPHCHDCLLLIPYSQTKVTLRGRSSPRVPAERPPRVPGPSSRQAQSGDKRPRIDICTQTFRA